MMFADFEERMKELREDVCMFMSCTLSLLATLT